MLAFSLPKGSEDEKNIRTAAIQDATKFAILTPFKVMHVAFKSMALMKEMVEKGNPNSVTDAAVGALCARTAVIGAFMNVRINAPGLHDKEFIQKIMNEGQEIQNKAIALEQEIIQLSDLKINANA
jgi:glutamate formiminotransferase/formiminotetrahydrofolate cyclodeaminase